MFVNSYVTEGFTLPSALLDEPRRRNLDETILSGKGGNRRIIFFQRLEEIAINRRILEETSRISDHFRVRKFPGTDLDHRVADRADGHILNIFLSQHFFYGAVTRVQTMVAFRQT